MELLMYVFNFNPRLDKHNSWWSMFEQSHYVVYVDVIIHPNSIASWTDIRDKNMSHDAIS